MRTTFAEPPEDRPSRRDPGLSALEAATRLFDHSQVVMSMMDTEEQREDVRAVRAKIIMGFQMIDSVRWSGDAD